MKFAMDPRLEERLRRWHDQLEVLKGIEETFMDLQASEKPFYSELFLKAEGKSIAEREANVYASDEWKTFSVGLAKAHSSYNHERRTLELKIKAFDAEYLGAKHEADAIRKMA